MGNPSCFPLWSSCLRLGQIVVFLRRRFKIFCCLDESGFPKTGEILLLYGENAKERKIINFFSCTESQKIAIMDAIGSHNARRQGGAAHGQ